MSRSRLAAQMAGDRRDPMVPIVEVLTFIRDHGREGAHEDDPLCGCGRCCAMKVRGLSADLEGRMAALEEHEDD